MYCLVSFTHLDYIMKVRKLVFWAVLSLLETLLVVLCGAQSQITGDVDLLCYLEFVALYSLNYCLVLGEIAQLPLYNIQLISLSVVKHLCGLLWQDSYGVFLMVILELQKLTYQKYADHIINNASVYYYELTDM